MPLKMNLGGSNVGQIGNYETEIKREKDRKRAIKYIKS